MRSGEHGLRLTDYEHAQEQGGGAAPGRSALASKQRVANRGQRYREHHELPPRGERGSDVAGPSRKAGYAAITPNASDIHTTVPA